MVIVLPNRDRLVYRWLYSRSNNIMKVKELIKLLNQAPKNIEINIYDIKDDCLGTIKEVWFPKTKLDKRDNNQVQITIIK